jgi:hypothetical protein
MGVLSIVYGSTTIDLDTSSTVLLQFTPKPPAGKESISETAEVLITGANVAAVSSQISAIQTAFWQAKNYQDTKRGERVYVHFLPSGASDTRRAEILNGRLVMDNDALQAVQWGAKKVQAAVIWERVPFWESTTETAIPISNGNGTNTTSGLNVFNCNDGTGTSPTKKNNYVDIGAGVILGNAPAPFRIEMTNQYNSASRLYNIWLAHNVFSSPTNFQHILEAESVSYGLGGGNSASSGYSGGYTRSFVWAGDVQTGIARWALDATYLSRAAGQWFKVLAAFASSPGSGIKLQCKVTFPSGTPLTEVSASQEITLNAFAQMQDIGTLQIPPWLIGETSLEPVDLMIYARKVGGGSIGLDFVQITPLDGYRILVPRGYGAAYQVRVADDGMSGQVWTDGWSGAGKTGHYTTVGDKLQLLPGKAQRLYFLQNSDTGGISISRQLSVKLYYRPRYEGV